MRDLRFVGRIDGQRVDITFRTDAINATDNNFTVLQISQGDQFTGSAETTDIYKRYFSQFQRLPYALATFKAYATTKGLDLRSTNSDGSDLTFLVNDPDVSDSFSA